MKNPFFKLISGLLVLFAAFSFIACSEGVDEGGGTTPAQIASSIAIGVSASSVSSGGESSIQVTASLLDQNNAAVEGVPVSFSASTGKLSMASLETDSSGLAQVDFSSGYNDQSNRTATITATAGALTAQVPVQITGSAVTVNQNKSTLIIGEAPDSLEIYVTNSVGTAINNTPVTIAVAASSTGNVTMTPTSGNTGVEGTLDVSVSGANAGTVTLMITAAGATASCQYMVESAGNVLQITSPTDPASMATDQSLTIVVADPNPGPSNQVVLSTTLGTLTNGGSSGSAVILPVSGGQVTAVLTSSTAGIATIQAYDKDSPGVTDSITVAMYAPASDANSISIQASNTVVAVSTAQSKNSVQITARVLDDNDVPVGQAPVVFTMTNTTGGGEYISPSIVYTDVTGVAKTTFTSGSLSSAGDGVRVSAYVLGSSPTIETLEPVEIIIGGTAGSVSIGVSTDIESVNEGTAYRLAVSILVSDSNGNPVPGAEVTMNLWPYYYYAGNAYTSTPEYDWWGPFANEDDPDRNLNLDPGEDLNDDGQLTPGISTAGSMPGVVTVDENGVGTFDWIYLKSYAWYVRAEISASTFVLGSETTSSILQLLIPSQDDVQEGSLGWSPFLPPTGFVPPTP